MTNYTKNTVMHPMDGAKEFFMVCEPAGFSAGKAYMNDYDPDLYNSFEAAEQAAQHWLRGCDEVMIMSVTLTAHTILTGGIKKKELK